MMKHLTTSLRYTLLTAILLGLVYPLGITAVAHVLFPYKASGQLLTRGGQLVGSELIGQPFSGPGYFHSRPSAAGAGYDAANSSGSNLAQTNKTLVDRIQTSSTNEANVSGPVPIDLVTTSGSGLDPDITPAAALYQMQRIASQRKLPTSVVEQLVADHITPRQFGLLGEARVNVLQLNLRLDEIASASQSKAPDSVR